MSSYERGSRRSVGGGGSGGGGDFNVDDIRRWANRQGGQVGWIALAVLLVVGAFTSYYQIEPDEVGVVLRFGKHIGNSEPGPHFRIPFWIDRVEKVPVQRQLKMEFGFRTTRADIQSQYERPRVAADEAKMLTGDLNVAIVEWIVQYRIANPEKYLFRFRDIEATLRLMAEATMRAVIGDHSIDEVLTGGRTSIESLAKERLQELSERYDTGITIQQLKLQGVDAPEEVRASFREVEEAKQQRERAINDAWAEYNKVVPLARGEAQQSIENAEGYRVQRVNRAEGDASRFNALQEEYRKAPAVTRTRLYLEGLQRVMPKTKQTVIVDSEAKGLLPLLNLSGERGGQR
ncbi:MAG: FtsH protease activity modulator HflK [Myxococcota bacterium]